MHFLTGCIVSQFEGYIRGASYLLDSITFSFNPLYYLNTTMGWFSDDSDQAQAYDQVVNAPHKAALSHELIAAAASYEAAKAYENHCAENGQPPTHAKAKELLAAFSGAFVDRMVETKGLDYIDNEKAKHHARRQAEEALADSGDY
ncbi:hypothetical protein BJ165DRAFT_1520963 [Panaeolus papilionaceus]|nr:hypothetical protein BJ165DRAFT_1520963 [Panaeolus papilionaceus]